MPIRVYQFEYFFKLVPYHLSSRRLKGTEDGCARNSVKYCLDFEINISSFSKGKKGSLTRLESTQEDFKLDKNTQGGRQSSGQDIFRI